MSTLQKYIEKKIDFPLTNIVLRQDSESEYAFPSDFKCLHQFKSLQSIELYLHFSKITSEICDELNGLPLTSLKIFKTDTKLSQLLKQFPTLTKLGLKTQSKQLKELEGCPSLTDLDVDSSWEFSDLALSDEINLQAGTRSFSNFPYLPNLKVLHIKGGTLVFSDLVSCLPYSLKALHLSEWKNDVIDVGKLVHLNLEEIALKKSHLLLDWNN